MSKERKELIREIRKLADLIKATSESETNIARANLILTYITRLELYFNEK
jgi:hypothetical protein